MKIYNLNNISIIEPSRKFLEGFTHNLFNILKFKTPILVNELFVINARSSNMHLILPKDKIKTAKCNFVFKASSIWNARLKPAVGHP